ncbi:MAG: YkgJ family cysteine cluster protein [Deltaproteobacteria bacterium]|nr:MAG: YkgJ family cysteine cluster protein [Deltaproteobacteria bacterium]
MNQHSENSPDSDRAQTKQLFLFGHRKDFVAGVRLALRQVLERLHVGAHYSEAITIIKREPLYRDLNNTWEQLAPPVRSEKWQELMERLVQVAYATRPYCLRCGECCHLGSPSLHLEDADLLLRGLITTRQIYTLRRGEPVRFNLEARLGVLEDELIKIKEDQTGGHCRFYEVEQRRCLIYHHRPLQCRVQACWNPGALENLWNQEKLTRRHLVKDDSALLEILGDHDEQCTPEKLHLAFKRFHESKDAAILNPLVEVLKQDLDFRALVRAELRYDNEELDFLFGRPLVEIVRAYGVWIEKAADGTFRLVQKS